jgi:Flp pilus assembly protein TadD
MIALNSSAAAQKPSGTQIESVYQRGMAALQRRDLSAARAAFERVVRLAPNSPDPHNSLGWVLLNQGQVEPAIAQFHTALRLKPNFPQARINLANALAQGGKLEDAEAQAREAARIAPNDSEAHRTRESRRA